MYITIFSFSLHDILAKGFFSFVAVFVITVLKG